MVNMLKSAVVLLAALVVGCSNPAKPDDGIREMVLIASWEDTGEANGQRIRVVYSINGVEFIDPVSGVYFPWLLTKPPWQHRELVRRGDVVSFSLEVFRPHNVLSDESASRGVGPRCEIWLDGKLWKSSGFCGGIHTGQGYSQPVSFIFEDDGDGVLRREIEIP